MNTEARAATAQMMIEFRYQLQYGTVAEQVV